jgi:DNA-binding winged helix-turn-helix (wHTH) protein
MPVRFGEYEFDGAGHRLTRGGARVHLVPKAFELLALLLERRPAAVSKADIHDRLWPRTVVSESTLTTLAAQLRTALAGAAGEGFVRTVYGYGYAFEEPWGTGAAGPRPCLLWQRLALPLAPGENVVGRGSGSDVPIVSPGVSRRHALVSVSAEVTTIEDLGSRNGTFVGSRPVSGPVPLADGDTILLGWVRLVYRLVLPDASTDDGLPRP